MSKILEILGLKGRRSTFEEEYLSRSIDRADFAAREKRLAYGHLRDLNLWNL